jgi:RNA polymerase sigma factor (sigma-70 family)
LPLVRDLPPKQRAVLVLRYLFDLGDAEIAETLGIGLSTVRTQAMRALAALRAAHPDPSRGLALITATTEELR